MRACDVQSCRSGHSTLERVGDADPITRVLGGLNADPVPSVRAIRPFAEDYRDAVSIFVGVAVFNQPVDVEQFRIEPVEVDAFGKDVRSFGSPDGVHRVVSIGVVPGLIAGFDHLHRVAGEQRDVRPRDSLDIGRGLEPIVII
ncbi:hypothetical protein [Halalkaliarchaeum desulfuricum]|uniref:hypothetical protein n=1 Tax=Halalkaliarchaeum desulfuricum TaxID=2055893 RepID=UPI001FE5FD74|nr:hypothetical protein [Halalkaliarchaeum desulfuricum]